MKRILSLEKTPALFQTDISKKKKNCNFCLQIHMFYIKYSRGEQWSGSLNSVKMLRALSSDQNTKFSLLLIRVCMCSLPFSPVIWIPCRFYHSIVNALRKPCVYDIGHSLVGSLAHKGTHLGIYTRKHYFFFLFFCKAILLYRKKNNNNFNWKSLIMSVKWSKIK